MAPYVSVVNIPTEAVRMPKPTSTKKPTSAPYHHGDLRRALVQTALNIVREEGTWNFTLREVARRAGVSHAAPYNHFADKLELLAEVGILGFEALRRAMERGADPERLPPREAITGIGVAYILFGIENPAHYRLMFGPELAERGRHPAFDRAGDASFAVLTRALERGQLAGMVRRESVPQQALTAWSLVHGLTTLLIDRRLTFLGVSAGEAAEHARRGCQVLLDGLGATDGPR
jgi:AcrR family transcriptional regulator